MVTLPRQAKDLLYSGRRVIAEQVYESVEAVTTCVPEELALLAIPGTSA